MKKKLFKNCVALVLGVAALVSCSGGANNKANGSAANLIGSYVANEKADGNYGKGSFNALVYQVNLYEENVYEFIKTEVMYGYGMVLGTTTIVNHGTYVAGTSEDGIAEYTLNAASEVLFNSYSKAGGYNISINTQNQTYPVELLAKTQGEKNMANSKEDIIKEYGTGYKIYCETTKNTFSFKKEGSDSVETVTTTSGDISKVFIEEVKSSNIVNNFINPGNYGEGSWTAEAYQVNVFESGEYEFIKTELIFGYGMVLGTTTIVNYGTTVLSEPEDGYQTVKLNAADRVIFNSFSKAGGYNIKIDTANCTYPVELLAKNQGEKNMANSKEDVVKEYGPEATYYVSTSKNELSLTNPNA